MPSQQPLFVSEGFGGAPEAENPGGISGRNGPLGSRRARAVCGMAGQRAAGPRACPLRQAGSRLPPGLRAEAVTRSQPRPRHTPVTPLQSVALPESASPPSRRGRRPCRAVLTACGLPLLQPSPGRREPRERPLMAALRLRRPPAQPAPPRTSCGPRRRRRASLRAPPAAEPMPRPAAPPAPAPAPGAPRPAAAAGLPAGGSRPTAAAERAARPVTSREGGQRGPAGLSRGVGVGSPLNRGRLSGGEAGDGGGARPDPPAPPLPERGLRLSWVLT